MSPVEVFPRVRVWLLVVARSPFPWMYKAPVVARPALIDAVGIPAPMLLMKANLAEFVAVPPSNRSSVILSGERAPRFLWKYCAAPARQLVPFARQTDCPLTTTSLEA